MIGIYKIENKVNNKIYIGQSINIERRWNDHKRRYNDDKADCYYSVLYTDMRNYGIKNFLFTVAKSIFFDDFSKRSR